jgi:hypothetical protein
MKDFLANFLRLTFIFDPKLLTEDAILQLDLRNYLQDFVAFIFKYCDAHIDVSYFCFKLWYTRFCINCKDLFYVLACLAKVEAN